jgi:hypothetical protein
MKNIVLCSDGTGNSGGKGYGTNVWRLFTALDLNGHTWRPELCEQIAYHDDGVGSRDNPLVKAIGGALGLGLKRNLRQLYSFLVDNYEVGDQIYIFGFSRGAYTARALAGLIAVCGILDRRKYASEQLERLANRAIAILRSSFVRGVRRSITRGRAVELAGEHTAQSAAAFRHAHCVRDAAGETLVPIRFVGVWDTVDAYGLPSDHIADFIHYFIYAFRFPDRKLSKQVHRARHALSIDDERQTFHPVLWDESDEHDGRIEQAWFAGVHSNVGGGYPKQGLALLSLDWIMAAAEQPLGDIPGLRFIAATREAIRRSANPFDKLYNSRSGLALYYRYDPRDLTRISREHGIAVPSIHSSVFRRIRAGTEAYAPLNLPSSFRVATTNGADHDHAVPIEAIAQALAAAARPGQRARSPLLDALARPVTLRRFAHHAVVAATLGVALVAGYVANNDAPSVAPGNDAAGALAAAVGVPLPQSVIDFLLRPFAVYPWLAWIVGALLLAIWLASMTARRRLRQHGQRFWRALFART